MKSFVASAGLIVATTIGAGIFALPYLFSAAGWITGIFYLAVLSGFIIFSHTIYWRVLEKVREQNRLVGLARTYVGKAGYAFGVTVIVAGLIFTLVAYLVLARDFMFILFPRWGPAAITIVFWLTGSLPLLLSIRRIAALEIAAVVFMVAVILSIFLAAPSWGLGHMPGLDVQNIFLPFGAILFSLEGWTAVEPAYDASRRTGRDLPYPGRALGAGTFISAILYFLFVLGVLNSPAYEGLASGSFSGLTGASAGVLALFGLFAIWTSYVPIGLEIKNALRDDLRWPKTAGLAAVFFIPPFLVFLGFDNFLRVIELVGGVFLALQYVLILWVGQAVLRPKGVTAFFIKFVSAVFLLAAVYEAWRFLL